MALWDLGFVILQRSLEAHNPCGVRVTIWRLGFVVAQPNLEAQCVCYSFRNFVTEHDVFGFRRLGVKLRGVAPK